MPGEEASGTASRSWQGAHGFSQIWRGPRISQVSRFSAPSGVERLPPHPPGRRKPGDARRGDVGRPRRRAGVGKQVPSAQGRRPQEAWSGAGHRGGPSRASRSGERPSAGGAASPGRPGLRREALGRRGREGGARRARGRRGSREDAQNGAGAGLQGGRERDCGRHDSRFGRLGPRARLLLSASSRRHGRKGAREPPFGFCFI